MKKIFCPLVVIFLALAVKPVLAVEPMLKLTPSSGTYTKNTSFEVIVGVDSGSVETQAIDVHIKYDPVKVEIESATAVDNLVKNLGVVFAEDPTIDNVEGKFTGLFYLSEDVHPSQRAVLVGDLLKIKFKPKVAGTLNIDFNCVTGQSNESNIYDGVTTADMINCASNINGVYTINEGSAPNNPNPTAVPTAVPTAGTELPKTGSVETTIGLLIFGFVSLLSSLALKFL